MRFIDEYKNIYEEAVKIDPITYDLIDTDKPYILISQDEKIHHRYCKKFGTEVGKSGRC